MKTRIFALLLCLVLLLTGCGKKDENEGYQNPEEQGTTADLGDDNKSFGESLDDLGAYDGYFEGESTDIVVECVSGTDKAYKLEGTTLTFTTIGEETVYSISGKLRGNIVIDVGEGHKLDLEFHGLSLVCNSTNPITVISGDEVAIQAKKDTKNYIYDMRSAIDETDETLYSGAIHSDVDLEIGGKGELTVVSENNNGIHSKDDLQVKNLTLLVACIDNSVKGNDGVEIEGGNTTLIASGGDCIKTSNSDISAKGNQRGSVSIVGGTHNLYAACDGIDAAYNVSFDDSTTALSIYTDKYSNYSKEVTATSSNANYTSNIQVGRFGGGRPGGPGGGMGAPGEMGGGNTDKGEYSTKGIKAANEIVINNGTVNIKSYDDAIHANNDTALENGATPLGNVTVNGGNITLYSSDDGLHADGTLNIKAGTVSITNSYEGVEGTTVNISGGYVSVNAKDDGINGTGTGVVITIGGGNVYVYCSGDGLDAGSDMNSTAKILFSGGNTVIISTSGGNSAIDTNSGYTQSGNARVVAIMPTNAMTGESTQGNTVGMTIKKSISLSQGEYLTVNVSSSIVATVKIPKTMTAFVVYLGSNSATIASASSSSQTLDENGAAWN